MLNTPRMSYDAIRRKLAEDALRTGAVDEHGGRDLPDCAPVGLLDWTLVVAGAVCL